MTPMAMVKVKTSGVDETWVRGVLEMFLFSMLVVLVFVHEGNGLKGSRGTVKRPLYQSFINKYSEFIKEMSIIS